MARAIGIDIGARFVKVVELVGGSRSFRVQRVAIREIPDAAPQEPESVEAHLSEDLVIDERETVGLMPETPRPETEGPTREERISELLTEIFSSLKLAREDVCAAYSSGGTIEREIPVPFFEEDQIKKVVRFEAENHLHSHAVEDVVVNWIKTGETKDGSRLTIFATPKQQLAEHIAIMRRARIDPASMDLDATATYTALEAAGVLEEHPNTIVVDIGASTTMLMMVEGGRPRVIRTFRLGVGNLESEIGTELGVSGGEGAVPAHRLGGTSRHGPAADDLLVPAGDLDPTTAETEKSLAQLETDVVQDHRSEFVRKLYREAYRTLGPVLAAASPDTAPDRILMLGGGSLIPGVAESLSERFGLPAAPLDLTQKFDCKDPGPEPAFTGATIAPAVGAALRMFGRDPLGIELLQDEFAARNLFEVIRTTLATTVTLLFLVVGVWLLATREELKAERTRYSDKAAIVELMTFKAEMAYLKDIEHKTKDLAEKQAKRWVRALPRDEKRIVRMRNQLIRRHRFLQSELGLRTDIAQLPSAVKVMFEIYKALSSVERSQLGTFFQISDLSIRERNATVKIIVDNDTVFDTVGRLLSKSPYFKDRAFDQTNVVEQGSAQSMKDGRKKSSFSFKFRED